MAIMSKNLRDLPNVFSYFPKLRIEVRTVKQVQQRNLIIFSVIVLALFLTWLFVINMPYNAQYSQISSQLSEIEKFNAEIRSIAQNVSLLSERKNKSTQRYQDLLKKIPTRDRYLTATETIRMLIAEHNLKLDLFTSSTIPLELEGGAGNNPMGDVIIDKYPTDVGLTGDYLDFGHFLDDLEKLPYLFAVENIMIQPAESQDSLIISIIIYTYVRRGET